MTKLMKQASTPMKDAMTLTADNEDFIYLLAIDYWYFDVLPPQEYCEVVSQYIKKHPEEFRGATPQ